MERRTRHPTKGNKKGYNRRQRENTKADTLRKHSEPLTVHCLGNKARNPESQTPPPRRTHEGRQMKGDK